MTRPPKTFLVLGPILLILASAASPVGAVSPRPRLALVDVSDTLADAVETGLGAWSVSIERVAFGSTPAAAGTVAAARQIAARTGSDAVVWISSLEGTTAVWIFDSHRDRVSAESLSSAPPYDEPTAAAVALTIKTLLRHSRVAPLEQRVTAEPPVIVPPAPSPSRFRPSIGVTDHVRANAPDELRLVLGLEREMRRAIVVGLRGRVGLGRSLTSPGLTARLTSYQASVDLGARLSLGRSLGVDLAAGGGATFDRLQISAPSAQTVTRLNPTVHTRVALGADVGPHLTLGLELVGLVNLRRQRYELDGELQLATPRLEAAIGPVLWLRL